MNLKERRNALLKEQKHEVKNQFTERITADNDLVKDGRTVCNRVYGNSIVWSQIFNIKSTSATNTKNGVTLTDYRNGYYSLSGTAEVDNIYFWLTSDQIPSTSGHKYCFIRNGIENGIITICLNKYLNESSIISSTYNGLTHVDVQGIMKGMTFKGDLFYLNIFDLTQMFGSDAQICSALNVPNLDTNANKQQAIANFKKLFPKDYYEYCSGKMLDFKSLPDVSGWNQYIGINNNSLSFTRDGITFTDNRDGSYTINGTSTNIVSIYYLTSAKGTIICNVGDKFYIHGSTQNIAVFNNGNGCIGSSGQNSAYIDAARNVRIPIGITIHNNATFNNVTIKPYVTNLTALFGSGNEPSTVEEFEAWMREHGMDPNEYQEYNAGGTLSGSRVESYDEEDALIDTCKLPISSNNQPLILRSAGNVHDEVVGNKVIRRVGVVDLGTLNWHYNSGNNPYFSTTLNSIKAIPASIIGNLLCPLYKAQKASIVELVNMQISSTDKNIYLSNNSYSDASTFKSAMSGVLLNYELETPYEESIPNWSNVYESANLCTEKLLPENTSVPYTSPLSSRILYKKDYDYTVFADNSGNVLGDSNSNMIGQPN